MSGAASKTWGVWWRSARGSEEGWCDVDGADKDGRATLAACIEWMRAPCTTPDDTYEIRPHRAMLGEHWEVRCEDAPPHAAEMVSRYNRRDYAVTDARSRRGAWDRVRLVKVTRWRVTR